MAIASTPHPRHEPLPAVGTSEDGVQLPQDLLYEILLRLPDKPLCRFRAVCTSWRSLLCDRDFIAAHQHHHPPKTLAVGLCGFGQFHFVAMNMRTGCVIQRVSAAESSLPHEMPAVSPDRAVCVVGGMDKRASLMDFATGAVSLLPDHAMPCTAISYALGRAASTGEYKVLAIATLKENPLIRRRQQQQVCKILTLGVGRNGGSQHWRGTESPSYRVVFPSYKRETTVIEGVAYFSVAGNFYYPELNLQHDWIMAFNLDSETWRPAPIQGPKDSHGIGLAELDGHLAAFHDDRHTCVKLWYLADPDHAIWCMLQQIVLPYHTHMLPSPLSPPRYDEYFEKPLAVLGDGRIVVWMRVPEDTVLRIYDPRTGDFTDGTRVVNCHNMGVHKCSMLYIGRGGGVVK